MRKFSLVVAALMLGLLVGACNLSARNPAMEEFNLQAEVVTGTATSAVTPSATIPPSTPLSTLTPSQTLKPPPTFEAPTATPFPSLTPTITATATLDVNVSIPGLRGAESPTPSTTPGCELREDWGLTYTVQANDALARIAERYGTYATTLAQGNCLSDANFITIGQVLHVPGESQPVDPEVECVPFELMTPANGTLAIEGEGTVSFNWRGPRAPRNLIRIHRPDGSIYERVIELRQNESIDLYEHLWQAGTYTWYVYPLDSSFVQACPEGGPWTFMKEQSPTATPEPTDIPDQQQQQPSVIVVTATQTPEIVTEEAPIPTEEVIEEPDESSVEPEGDTGGDSTEGGDTTGD